MGNGIFHEGLLQRSYNIEDVWNELQFQASRRSLLFSHLHKPKQRFKEIITYNSLSHIKGEKIIEKKRQE